MRYLLSIFFLFFCLSAFSQVDRIELGYQTSKRGIEWTRPGLPTHVPVFRISRDTNAIIWHDKNTGIRYDWDYITSVWYARGRFSSSLPPLPTQTSGLATIDNRTGFYLNASNILHRYDITQTAWVPMKITYQSAAPANVASGVSNGAAIYTTTLWQDSDDFLIRYWDGDSWELIGNAGAVTSVGLALPTSVFDISGSPVTSTGTLTATFDNQSANTVFAGPTTGGAATPAFRALVAADITTGGGVVGTGVVNQIPYFSPNTTTITTEAGTTTNSLAWDATNNRLGLRDFAPSADFTISNSNSGITGGIRLYEGTDAADYWNIWTGGGGNHDGYLNFTNKNTFIMNMNASGTQFFKGLFMNENNGTSITNVLIRPIQHGNSYISFERLSGVDGALKMAAWGHLNFLTGSNSNAANVDVNGQWGFNMANGSQGRTVDINGEVRIRDLVTTTPTLLVSSDANGVLSTAGLSGLSFSAGTLTATDGSTTNELQTYGHAGTTTYTNTLSSGGGSWSITGAGIAAIGQTAGAITVTATEVDGSVSNEGVLGVGAGSGTSSTLLSTTSGANAVTINAAGILAISESTSANGGSITLTATEVDGSVTNEAQTLSTSGTTSGILNLSTAGGAGGGTATIAAGTGITVGQSGGTITITNSSPATAGWLLDGNTIGAAKRIGSNDNFDVVVETNGTDRMWFDNAGTVSIGATQLTTAQLNINTLGSTNIGMLISGGSSLVGPTFYSATGSGSGTTATVFSGVVSMVSGNVEALVKNTASTGSGGALITLNSHQSSTGDPKTYYTTNGTTDWTSGIDNSVSGDPFKITANSDLGGATPAVSATTANKVGINQAAAVVTLQVTGTDAIGLPTGTTAQRSAAAIPQIRHNNTFSGLEFYDQNKNLWYRLTAVSTPTVASNTAAGTGHSGNVLAGELSSDVRGVLELNTGSASTAVGTVMTVTYASAFSGTKTVVLLDAGNDIATTQRNRFRVDTQSNTGFTIRAVTALDINETYVIKYYVGQ